MLTNSSDTIRLISCSFLVLLEAASSYFGEYLFVISDDSRKDLLRHFMKIPEERNKREKLNKLKQSTKSTRNGSGAATW